jgi:hypothetical protein
MSPDAPRLAFIAATLALIAGCTTSVRYVAIVAPPDSPSITVIPMSPSPGDFAAADAAAGHMVSFGLRVVERPALAKLWTETKGQSASADGTAPASSPSNVVKQTDIASAWDPVALLGETRADYVLFVGEGPRVRLVQRESGRVLCVGSLAVGGNNPGCCLAPGFWGALQPERERYRQLFRNSGLTLDRR